jgi:non-heme chloroperoxidase
METRKMASIKTSGSTEIFFKDWGPKTAPPIVLHHGWPLSADDWDNQMMFFLSHGYRVIAHDRRGHGRSTQTDIGNDMDSYASDVATLVDMLDLRQAVHIGHSAGGGEVARYVARAKSGRVAKAVLIGAVTPHMLQTPNNPGGCQYRYSMVFERPWPATGLNSTEISPQAPSTASTGPAPRSPKVSLRTGGTRP